MSLVVWRGRDSLSVASEKSAPRNNDGSLCLVLARRRGPDLGHVLPVLGVKLSRYNVRKRAHDPDRT
jgi:hypothetical protein